MTRTVVSRKDAIAGLEASFDDTKKARDLRQALDHYVSSDVLESLTKPRPVPRPDAYTERLLKYIPGEVVALYLALDAVIRSAKMVGSPLHWVVFFFGLPATILFLWRIEKVDKPLQLIISTVAYCIWVFALSGPFVSLGWYNPVYGAILLPMYTFIIPIVEA